MFSSRIAKKDIVFEIYKDTRTVFRLNDIAMLTGETDFQKLNLKLNYYVRTNKLLNPRKGVYAKSGYKSEEMACSIYKPAYISLDYVLQKAGVIFQYNTQITAISYLSRTIEIDSQSYNFRKIKENILVDCSGISRLGNFINIASPERAFLDMLYLDNNFYFDNLNPLNKDLTFKLLPLYNSKSLIKNVNKLL